MLRVMDLRIRVWSLSFRIGSEEGRSDDLER